MTRKLSILAVLLLASFSLLGDKAEEKARFKAYKEMVKKDPSLIRFYTFEEGQGVEVANHVTLDPSQTATTGGPLGSLTLGKAGINEQVPFPVKDEVRYISGQPIPPTWTRGRWPWKAAVTSAYNTGKFPWNVSKFYRSGITGAEFGKSGTLSGWIRIHENSAPTETCRILTLGDGFGNGFILAYSKNRHTPKGTLLFKLGAADKKQRGTLINAEPVSQGIWHFFTATFDGSMAKLYLDGKLKSEKPFTAKIVPTTYKDQPQCTPFFENTTPTRFGSYLMLAHNVARKGKVISRFDFGEFAIYKRALSAKEIDKLYLAGRPETTNSEQLADYRAVMAKKAIQDQIRMVIPFASGRYFRINKPILATVDIPEATGLKGNFRIVFETETLAGKPIQKWERTVNVGEKLVEPISFKKCGIYYLNMTLLDPNGKLVKKLSYKYCLGIVPEMPKELTANNPLAFWANEKDLFYYDVPIRRLSYRSKKQFKSLYDTYANIIPNFRAYVWFDCRIPKKADDQAFNEKLFTEAVEFMKDKPVFGLEVTSEPHTKNFEGYVGMLKVLSRIFRPKMPHIKIVPPGAAPPSIPMIAEILKQGGINYVDGISYHPYTNHPIAWYLWNDSINQLRKIMAQYPDKKLTLWATESAINGLPRIKGRPMTRAMANAAKFPRCGHAYSGFVSMVPETEAAAFQCHDILLKMAKGYKLYTIHMTPNVSLGTLEGGLLPSLKGVAITAIAGQVLNNQKEVVSLPLATIENMCILIKNCDDTTSAAIFSKEPAVVNFKVQPDTTYKTMDMLGNFGSIKSNADGLIIVKSTKAPLYIFNIPSDIKEVVPLKLTAPEVLPENGILKAKLVVVNPFSTPLIGTLSAPEIRGAVIKFSQNDINLAPGKSKTVAVELNAEFLKRRPYLLGVELKDKQGKIISAAQQIFQSQGVIQMVPQFKSPVKLDGDKAKWRDIPAVICDSADSVVKGKPNFAEVWLPQWRNKEDLSFSLKTAWRKDDGVYFLLNVTDNALFPAPDDKVGLAFKYDCLEFFFDCREHKKLGTVISDGADQVVIVPQISESDKACKLWYARKNRNHINVECVGRKTADGYLIEGKVTPNDKSDFRIRAGSQFMMDFLIDDTDSADRKKMRKAAMAVNGKFDNNTNSNIWGRYELSLDN